MALLEIKDLHTYYGKIHALRGVSLAVDDGEIVTLIGANGAGKTTTLNTISGLLVPKAGSVHFDGEDVTHAAPHDVTTKGVVQVPEGRRIFAQLTVEENLHMGAYTIDDKAVVLQGVENAFEMFPRLKERRAQVAGTLSGGEQQMLAMGRALMTKPRILLLDEPSMGLAPNLVESIFETIQRIHDEGAAILLVEQNAAQALKVASRGYVLQTGQILLADTCENLASNEDVRRSYLGEI